LNPVYILVSFGAAAVSIVVAFGVWPRRTVPGGKALVLLLAACAGWLLFSGFHELASELTTKILLSKIQSIGISVVPVAMLVFCLHYTGYGNRVTQRFLILIMAVPTATIIMAWTNQLHYLYWSEVSWNLSSASTRVQYSHGPFFWIWSAYAYSLVLTGTILFLRSLRGTAGVLRIQNAVMVLAIAAPWVSNVLYLSNLNPWPNTDLSPFGFVITGLAMSWGVFRLQISSIVPVARQSVLSSMTDAVFVLDQNGHLVDINPSGEIVVSRQASNILGEHVNNTFRAYPELLRDVESVSSQQQLTKTHEVNLGTKGEPAYYDLRVSQVTSHQGVMVGTVIVLRDINKLKSAEENRIQLEAQLQHSQKLESLGLLSGSIAHDFNNLLMGISGNAELALSELNPDSSLVAYLKNIERISHQAATLCQQLLAYSGKGLFVVIPLDINRVIRDMHPILDISIPKSITLTHELDEKVSPIKADLAQVQQLIMNIVINAVEAYGDANGSVKISTKQKACDQQFLDSMDVGKELVPGDYVSLRVIDTGIGMGEELRQKIFDPFFTTKFTGRGLGMSAALGIIRGHNGGIKIESEVDKGTIFTIIFPALAEEIEVQEIKPSKESWNGRGAILIIDDEEQIRDVTRHMLENIGFTVRIAEDGMDGIDQYNRYKNDIVCVLLDLTMPVMGGQECFTHLRSINEHLPIIVMSGFHEQEVNHKFDGQGLNGHLNKPFKTNQLLEIVRSVIEKSN
jgi:PAS domain S-box-containing protein